MMWCYVQDMYSSMYSVELQAAVSSKYPKDLDQLVMQNAQNLDSRLCTASPSLICKSVSSVLSRVWPPYDERSLSNAELVFQIKR